jgi:hypothetical protein
MQVRRKFNATSLVRWCLACQKSQNLTDYGGCLANEIWCFDRFGNSRETETLVCRCDSVVSPSSAKLVAAVTLFADTEPVLYEISEANSIWRQQPSD